MEQIEKLLLNELKEKRMIEDRGDYSAAICRKLEQKGWIKVKWSEQNQPIVIAQGSDFRTRYKRMFGA